MWSRYLPTYLPKLYLNCTYLSYEGEKDEKKGKINDIT